MFADAATIGVLFFLGFVGLGVAILTVLRYWLLDGVLEGGSALGLICILLLGSAWVAKSASPLLIFLWTIFILGGSVAWPVLSARSEKNALREIREDDVDKYKRALLHDINNAAAWRELGEAYFRLDQYDEAIAAYKEAIRLNPRDVQDIRRRLNRALDYRAGLPAQKRVICKVCHEETVAGKTCTHCGAVLETNFLEWILQPRAANEVLPSTFAILAGAVALLALFSSLPLMAKALIVAICLLAGAILLWRATRNTD